MVKKVTLKNKRSISFNDWELIFRLGKKIVHRYREQLFPFPMTVCINEGDTLEFTYHIEVEGLEATEIGNLSKNPDRMGGAWCIKGTRVLVSSILLRLSFGSSVKKIAKSFDLEPSVVRETLKTVANFF